MPIQLPCMRAGSRFEPACSSSWVPWPSLVHASTSSHHPSLPATAMTHSIMVCARARMVPVLAHPWGAAVIADAGEVTHPSTTHDLSLLFHDLPLTTIRSLASRNIGTARATTRESAPGAAPEECLASRTLPLCASRASRTRASAYLHSPVRRLVQNAALAYRSAHGPAAAHGRPARPPAWPPCRTRWRTRPQRTLAFSAGTRRNGTQHCWTMRERSFSTRRHRMRHRTADHTQVCGVAPITR